MQSRVRGTILMSVSNKFGPMVVTTGNKSEMSVGYATLYGDMNGGLIRSRISTRWRSIALVRAAQPVEAGGALGPDGVVIPPDIITQSAHR